MMRSAVCPPRATPSPAKYRNETNRVQACRARHRQKAHARELPKILRSHQEAHFQFRQWLFAPHCPDFGESAHTSARTTARHCADPDPKEAGKGLLPRPQLHAGSRVNPCTHSIL